jgi:hypothetical protein
MRTWAAPLNRYDRNSVYAINRLALPLQNQRDRNPLSAGGNAAGADDTGISCTPLQSGAWRTARASRNFVYTGSHHLIELAAPESRVHLH